LDFDWLTIFLATSLLLTIAARRKLDLEKIHASLNTICPHCGARIEPKDYKRVDWDHLECPKCGKKFVPSRTDGQSQ
jgi:uncharacterized protein (UPF0212 family)